MKLISLGSVRRKGPKPSSDVATTASADAAGMTGVTVRERLPSER